ncbi:hypothetical protein EVAR_45965_1 [Eumeta japonica]|uniref:Uncharacterized protein n=1 Tax=Eumeta variegata TaxID=151549 RepID=A0A4C1YRK8_EUMVA|nr:hypothetical protein EVAR_45965_1 [Eumeta japonica]
MNSERNRIWVLDQVEIKNEDQGQDHGAHRIASRYKRSRYPFRSMVNERKLRTPYNRLAPPQFFPPGHYTGLTKIGPWLASKYKQFLTKGCTNTGWLCTSVTPNPR